MAKRKLVDKTIRVAQIRVGKQHWNRDYDDKKMKQLQDSIADRGQLHNVIVRPSKRSKATYELLAGGRRYQAIRELGLEKINVKVADVDDVEARLISLDENLRVEHPTSGDWSQKLEEWRQLTNVQRGHDPDARPKGGPKVDEKKASKSKKKEANQCQVAPVSKAPVTYDEMAEEHGVSRRTVARAQRRERNLTPEAKAAWRLGKLTDSQVDELSNAPKDKQAGLLKQMLSEKTVQQQQAATERHEELSAAQNRVEMKKRLRACEDLCRKELVPELEDIHGAAQEDDLLLERLATVPTARLSQARDLIDSLLDMLSR